jgi:hypothetical protein
MSAYFVTDSETKKKVEGFTAGVNVTIFFCSDFMKNNYNVCSVIVSGINKVTNLTLLCST